MGKFAVFEPQKAYNSYTKAVTKFVLPNEQLAFLNGQQGKWKDVLDNIDPRCNWIPRARHKPSITARWQILWNVEAAQTNAMESLALDPQPTIPNTESCSAVILVQKGDYARALQHLRTCFAYTPIGPTADLLKKQIAKVEEKTGTAGTANPCFLMQSEKSI